MNFLSTPEFVTSTLHILSILTTPIHILGFYCILFKTPKSMESVKWCLLNSHVLNIFMDISMNVLVCPVAITPVIGGYTFGALNQFGVPIMLQWYLLLTVFLAVGAVFVSIVENRYYMMFARSSWWRHARYPFLILNYFFMFIGYIPPLFNVPDQEYAFRVVKREHPQIPITPSLFVITFDGFWIFLTAVLISITFVLEVLAFNFLLFFKMRGSKLSSKTYEMQKKFLIAILIQISIPTFCLLIPAIYFEYAILAAYYNQVMNNFCVILVSIHGWVSTVVMLLIHEPYRNFCTCWAFRKRRSVVSTRF